MMGWHWILCIIGVLIIAHALWDLYPHKPKVKRQGQAKHSFSDGEGFEQFAANVTLEDCNLRNFTLLPDGRLARQTGSGMDKPPTWPLNLHDPATLRWLDAHHYGYLMFDLGLVSNPTWDELVMRLRALSPASARALRLDSPSQPTFRNLG